MINNKFNFSKKKIVPIVFHKIVMENKINWEDVHIIEFNKVINYINQNWLLLPNSENNKNNKWILTFDDGNLSDYEIVFPKLLEKKIKAIFFIITNKIGVKGYLNKSQILEMHNNGMYIGSHSVNHIPMTSLNNKVAIEEFSTSKLVLEEIIGSKVFCFSYPYGQYSNKLNILGYKTGYDHLFSSSHGIAKIKKNILPRNNINSLMTWDDILEVLEPQLKKQLYWFIEDNLKTITKTFMSFENYKYIRSVLGKFLK